MPGCGLHHLAYSNDVLVWHAFVEQVAHRVDEDPARALPSQRLKQFLWHQPEVEALLVGVVRHTAKALGKRGGIAVPTSRADFGAAPYGVPSRVGPFDGASITHPILWV